MLYCLVPAPAHGNGLYRWQDTEGRWHFSDRAPAQQNAEDVAARYQQPDAPDIRIETRDYVLPTRLQQRLEVTVTRVFSIYRHTLAVNMPTDMPFEILLYGDANAFRQYQRQVAPRLENPAGFFNGMNGRITALALDDHDALLRLITHECSHAIAARQAGYMPIWLNEGLAEYFSQLQIYGLTAEIPVAAHWLQQLRGAPPAPGALRHNVDARHEVWQAQAARGGNYAISWSLVWFLMDTAEGRQLLRYLLARVANDPRPLTDSSAFIDDHWPGGFAALELAWQQWLPRAAGRHRY